MQRSSGSAICSLSIQACSYTDSVRVDLCYAVEGSVDLIDSCNICLTLSTATYYSMPDQEIYIDKINAREFTSLKPSLELFQGYLYQRWKPS